METRIEQPENRGMGRGSHQKAGLTILARPLTPLRVCFEWLETDDGGDIAQES